MKTITDYSFNLLKYQRYFLYTHEKKINPAMVILFKEDAVIKNYLLLEYISNHKYGKYILYIMLKLINFIEKINTIYIK